MQTLKPCPYRQVDDEGRILCDKIKSGEREVSPNICRACPVAAVHCAHLRASLDHQARPPITVHFGNGKTQIWEDEFPSLTLARAACAVKVTPILSPRDCAGCPLRQALVAPDAILTAAPRPTPGTAPLRRAGQAEATTPMSTPAAHPARVPLATPAVAAARPVASQHPSAAPRVPASILAAAPVQATLVAPPSAAHRSLHIAHKIIKLQEWLDDQKSTPSTLALSEDPVSPAEHVAHAAPSPRLPQLEEKRTGWTD